MFAKVFVSLLSATALVSSVVRAVPTPSTPTATIERRQSPDAPLVTVLAYVKVQTALGGLLDDCVTAQVAADAPTNVITDAIEANSQTLLSVGTLTALNICASVNNRQPICDSLTGTGCGLGDCIPGYSPNTSGQCVPTPAPSQGARMRRNRARLSLCPVPSEAACAINGSTQLTSADIDDHKYTCHDLSSSIESCGVCGNVCSGANEGCLDGVCVALA